MKNRLCSQLNCAAGYACITTVANCDNLDYYKVECQGKDLLFNSTLLYLHKSTSALQAHCVILTAFQANNKYIKKNLRSGEEIGVDKNNFNSSVKKSSFYSVKSCCRLKTNEGTIPLAQLFLQIYCASNEDVNSKENSVFNELYISL